VSIRAVLFDAGNTLLTIDYPLLRAQITARGHDVSLAAVMRAERLARMRLDHEQAAPATRERRGRGRYLRYLLDALDVTDEADVAAIAAWRRAYNLPVGLCHRPDVEATEALRRLRTAGITTGVISNSNGSVEMALERAGLRSSLDFVIDSTVAGVAKPDPRVFELGLSAAGVRAGETLYVGDSYFVDVRGARAVGMDAVLFDPGEVWGPRDCATAAGLCAASALALTVP
jgi:HAD superfamily hydrolase (TIGR01509 family)